MDELFTFRSGVSPRWATAENPKGEKGGACLGNDGRKRSPCIAPLRAGETRVLAEAADTSGTVRRIWITIPDRGPVFLRGLRLDMFWDGARTPAVSVPLGDFFCQPLGRPVAFQNALFSNPEGRSFNCCVPMPFRTGMRVAVTNDADRDVSMFFYEIDYTVGDPHGSDVLYFHSHWRREAPTTRGRDFEILPRVSGRGRYLGASLGAIANTGTYFKTWWGEGEVKVYLDGDQSHPTLCGTGTEDYIGTGWGQGAYAAAFQGCPLADHEKMHFGFYRLHIPDPVCFEREARVTIQQIGCWDPASILQMHGAGMKLALGGTEVDMEAAAATRGYGLFEREDDWCACSYFYLDRPGGSLPAIAPFSERVRGL